ncbi:MAG: ABC transporter ATP-binding protein, partial [Lachnospiraceae bacterium]|nr:ABC transporter ATP-binding protein [Lachnospiraceae bacterium]
MKKGTSMNTFKKLMKYMGGYKVLLFLAVLMACAVVVMTLYIPVLFGDAIDLIIGKGNVDLEGIGALMLKAGIIAGAAALIQWIMNIINNSITYRMVKDLREKAFRHIQTLPLSYLDSHATGDLVSRLIADADTLSDGLLLGLTQFFTAIVTIIVTLIFMIRKNLWIALLVLVLTPLSFFVARFIARRTYSMFKKQTELRGRQTGFTEEIIGNQKVVKAMGYEERAKDRFDEMNSELEKVSLKAVFYSSITNPSTRFVNSVIYAAVALTGAFMCLGEGLTVGGLSVLLYYANQYTKPFNDLSSVVAEFQNSLACAARIFELMEESPETPEGADSLEYSGGNISVRDVSFSYKKDKPFIEGLTFDALSGKKLALVGPTGCGKTTIINLLMRFYDIDAGSIELDGADIYLKTRSSLREKFGMVLQDTWIKTGTVLENITLGVPNASMEDVIEAAKAAHSYSFINRLPEGFNTVLNENVLSQGEKQLLCITRVMLMQPRILILDEATSNIDTRT